jgi:hypothetical protein
VKHPEIYINDIGGTRECRMRLFADDCIVYLEIKEPSDHEVLQKYLAQIEKWVQRNKMKLNNSKNQLIKFTKKGKQIRTSTNINSMRR